MKLSTHLITGFSIATSLALMLSLGLREAVLAGILALLINYVIDALGHRGPRRTPFLHSLLGVTLSTIALFASLAALEFYIPTLRYTGVDLGPQTFVSCYTGALTHLLLDAFTESGIYLAYPFSKKRYAIAHLDYDNPLINALASALAIALLLYSLWMRYGYVAIGVIRSWLGR